MEKPRWTLSLRTIVALVICVSIMSVSVLYVYQAYNGMKSSAISVTKIMARYLSVSGAQAIGSIFAPSSVTIRMLKHEKLTRATTLDERLEALPFLQEALEANNICSAVFIGYDSGDFFMLRRLVSPYPALLQPIPEGAAYFVQSVTRNKEGDIVGVLYFYDARLNVLERRGLKDYKYDPRTRPWYKRAMQSGQIEITPPYIFLPTGEIGVSIALRDEEGNSVIAMDTTAKDLSLFLDSLLITPDTEIAVVDDTGKVMAYPDINRLFAQEGEDYRLPQLNELKIPALNHLFTANVPENQLSEFNDGEQKWYGLVSTFPGMTGKDLKILIAIPSQAILAGVWENLKRQIYFWAIVALFLAFLGWKLGFWLVTPLHKISDRVSSLARFNFDTKIGDTSRISEIQKLGRVLDDMAQTISSFQTLSLTLNKEEDLELMLDEVLGQLLNIVHSDTGSIYLYDEKDKQLVLSASRGEPMVALIPASSAHLSDEDLEAEIKSYVGEHDILSILRNRGKTIIGVLNIRCNGEDVQVIHDILTPFVNKIAGSAAVAIETRQLIHTQKNLINSIITLMANAVDTKSHYTGGHCIRVPIIADLIIEQIILSGEEPFGNLKMTEAEKEEFKIAALLHDCGKITTPEYVVDKATKLEIIYNRIHEIRTRFEVLYRDSIISYYKAIESGVDKENARSAMNVEQSALRDDFDFIAKCNIGSEFMEPERIARLESIAQKTWLRFFDNCLGLSKDELARMTEAELKNDVLPATEQLLADKPSHIVPWGDSIPFVQADDDRNVWGFDMKLSPCMYNYGELHNLCIKAGTLTEEERFKINDHIVQTICMLSSLPFPKELSRVIDIAGNHHEHMDGFGYPRKLTGKEMSIPERVLVLADIFEALTAHDRPYKDAKTLTQALAILSRMAKENHVDKDIFNLFLQSGAYMVYAKGYLSPEQVDEIRIEDFLV